MDRTNGRLDAAVLAHRANPTPETHAALMAMQAEHHERFLLDQTIDFQIRTHN